MSYIEIKNKLTVTREEVGEDNGGKRGKGFQEHVERTHGQSQRGAGPRVGSGDGWGGGGSSGGDMETTVLEQQFFKNLKKRKKIIQSTPNHPNKKVIVLDVQTTVFLL